MEIEKITIVLDKENYEKYISRCKKEDISVRQCATKIIKAYANGANVIHVSDPKKKKNHAVGNGASYITRKETT